MESFGVGRPEAEQINKKLPIDAILRVQQMRSSINSIVGQRRMEENAAAEAEESEPEETEEGAAAEAEENEHEETVEGEAEEQAAEETEEGEAAWVEEQHPGYRRRRLDGNRWAVIYHRRR